MASTDGGAGVISAPTLTQQLGADFRAFFTTIAVLLGAGVLGLPVKLVYCGYGPFMVVMTIVLGMQIAMVYVQLDSLQRAQRALYQHRLALKARGAAGGGDMALPQPDLHTMGKMFLPRAASVGLDGGVLFMFVSIMITYGLAGSDAFAGFSGIDREEMITPFVGACTAALLLFEPAVQLLVSVLTSAKVTLLLFIIGTIGVVANAVGVRPHEDYTFFMEPFLVGTVAIGGISTMMPVMYPAKTPTKSALAHFKWAVIAGIIACYGLNAFWARFVLGIVPQTRADAAADNMTVSLEQAAANGDIATVPVIAVINKAYQQYNWVATTVQAFIALSITVSFNAVGLGLKSMLNGLAATAARFVFSNKGGKRTDCLVVDHKELEAAICDLGEVAPPEGAGTELSGMDTPVLSQSPALKRREAARDKLLSVTEAAEAAESSSIWSRITARVNPTARCQSATRAWRSPGSRALLLSRWCLYAVVYGAVWGIALGNPSGFLTVLEIFTSMTLNMSGGVFIAMMSAGAHFTEAAVQSRAAEKRAAGDNVRLLADVESNQAGDHGDDGDEHLEDARVQGLATSLMSTGLTRSLVYGCLITYAIAVAYDVVTASQKVVSDEGAGIILLAVILLMWRVVVWPIAPWLVGANNATLVRWWRFQKPKQRAPASPKAALHKWTDHWFLHRSLTFAFTVLTANSAAFPAYTVLGILIAVVVCDMAADLYVCARCINDGLTSSHAANFAAVIMEALVGVILAAMSFAAHVPIAGGVLAALVVISVMRAVGLRQTMAIESS